MCSAEPYLAGEVKAPGEWPADKEPKLRVVVATIPLPLSLLARCDVRTRWATLREISCETTHLAVSAALERVRVNSAPGKPVGVPMRSGRGATMSLTRDIAGEAECKSFVAELGLMEAANATLRAEYLRRAAAYQVSDRGRADFMSKCAAAVRPVPASEIPHGLRLETRDFSAPQLLMQPFSYKAVIPISDPPKPTPPPPTEWPAGVTPPRCEREFFTEECFRDAFAHLESMDAWHASGGARRRPEAWGCGLSGVQPQFHEFLVAGGVVDWTVDPPAPLVPGATGYTPRMNGARAAELFAASPDKRTTAAWSGVTARPFNVSEHGVLILVPNLLSVYPGGNGKGAADCGDSARALAAEMAAFEGYKWCRGAAKERSWASGSLGLTNAPFRNPPVGMVPKPVGFRVILEAGHPREDWFLPTGEHIVAHNVYHGPSRPPPGTGLRYAGGAPAAREFKPPVAEAVNNSMVVAHGAEASALRVYEQGWDFWKAFHQWSYVHHLLAWMCSIAPSLGADGALQSKMRSRRNHAMAMGWLPASKECQFGMNQGNAEVLRRTGEWDDHARARGEFTTGECAWHDARAGMPPNLDYGRQDILATLSTYADDPRSASAGVRRTCNLSEAMYEVFGEPGIDNVFADEVKWLCASWSAWQGVRMSVSLNLVWVSPEKALRTDSSLAAIMSGSATKQEVQSTLAFCNHVVGFLNAPPYALRTLWAWFDSLEDGETAVTSRPPPQVQVAIAALRRLVMTQPGTSMLRATGRRVLPYGAVTEWVIVTDACFDVVKDDAGRVVRGDKDPPGMGGDFYGFAWGYVFTEAELQFFTIPTAELTASWMGVLQNAARVAHASVVVSEIDALASPRVLTAKAKSDSMVEVHQEIMADPLYHEMVDVRRCLYTRPIWGAANPKGDAPSRGRWEAARQLAWQHGQALVREPPCEAAVAFKDRVAARLRALRERDVAAPGGWAIRSLPMLALLPRPAAGAAAPALLLLLASLPTAAAAPVGEGGAVVSSRGGVAVALVVAVALLLLVVLLVLPADQYEGGWKVVLHDLRRAAYLNGRVAFVNRRIASWGGRVNVVVDELDMPIRVRPRNLSIIDQRVPPPLDMRTYLAYLGPIAHEGPVDRATRYSATTAPVESARRHALEYTLDEDHATAVANATLDHLHSLTTDGWLDFWWTPHPGMASRRLLGTLGPRIRPGFVPHSAPLPPTGPPPSIEEIEAMMAAAGIDTSGETREQMAARRGWTFGGQPEAHAEPSASSSAAADEPPEGVPGESPAGGPSSPLPSPPGSPRSRSRTPDYPSGAESDYDEWWVLSDYPEGHYAVAVGCDAGRFDDVILPKARRPDSKGVGLSVFGADAHVFDRPSAFAVAAAMSSTGLGGARSTHLPGQPVWVPPSLAYLFPDCPTDDVEEPPAPRNGDGDGVSELSSGAPHDDVADALAQLRLQGGPAADAPPPVREHAAAVRLYPRGAGRRCPRLVATLLAFLVVADGAAAPSAAATLRVARPRPATAGGAFDGASPSFGAIRFAARRAVAPLTPPPPVAASGLRAPGRSPHAAPSPGDRIRRRLSEAPPPPALLAPPSAAAAVVSGMSAGAFVSVARRAAPQRSPSVSVAFAPRIGGVAVASAVAAATAVLAAPTPALASAAMAPLIADPLSPVRVRRATPLLFADLAQRVVPSYQLPAAARSGAAVVASRGLSHTAEAQIDDLLAMMLNSDRPWALRPSSPSRLRTMLSSLASLRERSAPDTTLSQERSAFKYWSAYCAEWGTSTTRPAARTLNADEYLCETCFWGAAIPWVHERMPSRAGVVGEAQPQSALNVIRCMRRAFMRLGIETVPLTAAVKACDGLLRDYIEQHGPEALIPHRKEPLTMPIIEGMLGLEGGKLGRVPLDWTRPEMRSLRCMFHVLAQTGFRKSEVSLHAKVAFGKQHLSFANVHWQIGGCVYAAPSAAQLASLQEGDYALLRPPPSKSDQFSLHWGASTIYLPYDPEAAICGARELAREEVRRAVPAGKRQEAPLFVGPGGGPWRHEPLNTVFHHLLVRVVGAERASHYSMHSWRIFLACALLSAGASAATIQSMLRWRSEDALRIYARINDAKYGDWLKLAGAATVSSVRTTTTSALAAALNQAAPAPQAGDRLAAFQAFWLNQARSLPSDVDVDAAAAALSGVEIDDSRRVAALQGQSAALLLEATRADERDAAAGL